ncbi:MAG: hypothetical protein IPF68_13595 [Bacteroidales bacterium]|nr:hypothetical protein [Bacteroidales bacterium]
METTVISSAWLLKLTFDFLMAMVLAFVIIPSIRAIARRWSLYDFDVSQEVTLSHIPRHGGIALVVAFGISIAVFSSESLVPGVKFILAALLLLLAAGLQDDLLHLSWFVRIMVVVGAAAIITDVAGMPLFRTGLGVVFDYPLPDLLVTYAIYTGCVVLLIATSRIPGMVSLILIVNAVALALMFLKSGFPELAILPVALAGASMTLFISSVGNYVFEGRASALAGGFMLAMLIIYSYNIGNNLVVDNSALFIIFLALIIIPSLVISKVIRWEHSSLLIFGKQYSLFIVQMLLMVVLLLFLFIL